jgi:hypothetical protein
MVECCLIPTVPLRSRSLSFEDIYASSFRLVIPSERNDVFVYVGARRGISLRTMISSCAKYSRSSSHSDGVAASASVCNRSDGNQRREALPLAVQFPRAFAFPDAHLFAPSCLLTHGVGTVAQAKQKSTCTDVR